MQRRVGNKVLKSWEPLSVSLDWRARLACLIPLHKQLLNNTNLLREAKSRPPATRTSP